MSGKYDPTRISTHELNKAEVRRRVKAIARTTMTEEWEWGLEPHNRTRLPEQVSNLATYTDILFSTEITLMSAPYSAHEVTRFFWLAEVCPAKD